MSLADIKRCFRIIVPLLLTLVTGCGFLGGAIGTGSGGGGFATANGLLNLADAAPDRVLALSFHISDVKVHQTSGASVSMLNNPAGLTVEMTHRQALFEPINLSQTLAQGTYDSVTITFTTAAVTFLDDAGVVQQDAAATVTTNTTTVILPATVLLTNTVPMVLNLQFQPSSVTINLLTNKATITPTFTATAVLAPSGAQTEANGLVRQITGVVTATPPAGATKFTISSSQLANPLTIDTDASTIYSTSPPGDIANFGSLVAGNIVQVQAVTVPGISGLAVGLPNLLAKLIDGENAGVGLTTGADLQGVVTSESVDVLTPFNVDAFIFRVQNVASTAAPPTLGGPITVNDFSAPTVFLIDQQDVDLTNIPPALFTPLFDRVHLRRAQEISAIYAVAGTTTAPKKIKLKLQTMPGTVVSIINGGVIGQSLIVFQPPADSIFTLLTGQTTLTVIQQPSTVVLGTVPAPGNPMHARGLLFFDTVSGTYFLVADQLTP